MQTLEETVETLREILENIRNPDMLDKHPWTGSLIVRDAVESDSGLADLSPGRQLLLTIGRLFSTMMPNTPPRRRLRLDTRWGEFGLLAAHYFSPLEFETPYSPTLRESWSRIDNALLFYVYGKLPQELSEAQIKRYRLVGDELEIGPASTISDWHRRGIRRLAETIYRKEHALRSQATTSESSGSRGSWRTGIWRWSRWVILLGIVASLILLGGRAWQVYQRIQTVRGHVEALETFSLSNLEAGQVEAVGEHLSALRADMSALKRETEPFLSLAPSLGWLPVYGGDLSQAPALLEMGTQLSIMGDETFQAVSPLIPDLTRDRISVSIPELLDALKNADTQLLTAQVALSRALAARQQIQGERLSERTRAILLEQVDPFLLAMQGSFPAEDVLEMARLAPRLLGAVDNGPQAYLILIQNEDELRPTGGFITAVGRMVVEDGNLTGLSFEGVSKLDDFDKPYPSAPWQLDEYMRSEILLLRDANWFTDFPTSVEWVEFLYAYARPGEIDGVIAVDQHVVVEILREIGSVQVEGQDEPVTPENVLDYMRQERSESTPAGVDPLTWDRKGFINPLAVAITQKILARQDYSLNGLLRSIMRLLDEKHILLQFDDPEMKALLAKRGWDGAVRLPGEGDYLMVVDANVGFNKTNLVVEQRLSYEVDLRDLDSPLAHLVVDHSNNAQVDHLCFQYPGSVGIFVEQDYPFNDCYWNYLRVYTPAGSELLASTPHAIPAGRTLRETRVPAQVDLLGDENIPGTSVYGTLMVVSPGESLGTGFDLRLPQAVLERDRQASTWTYRLSVQKQPGTLAVPFSLHLLLPAEMQVSDSSHDLQMKDGSWILETDLRQDLHFYLVMAPTN